jgi:hypothetical protein
MKMGQSFSISLCVGIALVFFWQIFLVSNNTPFLDDVNFIDFVYHFAKPDQPLTDFLTRLFMVDNNHMAVVPKIGLSLQYLLFQDINFKRILLISAFQLTLIGGWFFWQFKQTKKPYWIALPLMLCWFQPQYYEISNWAMAGIQQSSVILCSLLALSCIEKPGKKYLLLANLFAGLAFYSFGSGVLAYVGMGYFLLANKRYRDILWMIPLPLIQLGTYVYMSKIGSVANGSDIQIFHAIPFFLNLVGTMAMVSAANATQAAWILGGIMTVLAILGLLKINYQSKIAALLVMLFANCLLIVTSRDGLGIYMVSRFATLSPLIAMSLYLLYLPVISVNISRFIVFMSTVFWIGSYLLYLPVMYNQKHQARAEAANWSRNRTWAYATETFQLYASGVLIPSYEAGLWKSENTILNNEQWEKCRQAKNINLEMTEENQVIKLSNFPWKTSLNHPFFILFIHTQLPQKAYVKNIEFRINSKKNMLISGDWLMNKGVVSMQNAQMAKGSYQIYLFDPSSESYWKTNQSFTR